MFRYVDNYRTALTAIFIEAINTHLLVSNKYVIVFVAVTALDHFGVPLLGGVLNTIPLL